MTWQIAILVTVLISSINTIFVKKALSNSKANPILFSTYGQLFTAFFIAICAIYLGKFTLQDTGKMIPNLILTTLLYGAGNIFIFKALSELEASKYVVIVGTRGLVTTFFSILLISEKVTPQAWVGSILVLVSVIIISWERKILQENKKSIRSILYALLAALFVGTAAINDKVAMQYTNFYLYSFFAYLLPGILVYAIYFKETTNGIFKLLPNKLYLFGVLGFTFFSVTSGFLYFYAVTNSDQISKIMSISVSNVIITVLLSFIVLKDRKQPVRKLISSIICFTGLYLLN